MRKDCGLTDGRTACGGAKCSGGDGYGYIQTTLLSLSLPMIMTLALLMIMMMMKNIKMLCTLLLMIVAEWGTTHTGIA